MKLGSVITADIVASTSLTKPQLTTLMKDLNKALEGYRYEFFRGDSFQVYVSAPAEAFQLLLLLRATAMKLVQSHSLPVTDLRASIGTGQVKAAVKTLKTSTEEAFVLSGRAFDKIATGQRLVLVTDEKHTAINLGFEVIAGFTDYVLQHLTSKQAAVVAELLVNHTQLEIAKKLKRSQATINKHVQSAGWPQLEQLLQNYQTLVGLIPS